MGTMHPPATGDRELTLEVIDFGPLTEARIELRPLTVFVGPSNTGKSWLATLAYALHRYFDLQTTSPGWRTWLRAELPLPSLPEGATSDLVRIAKRLARPAPRSAAPAEETAETIELTPPVRAALRSLLGQQSGPLGEEIERCFGVDACRLVRRGNAANARILLRHPTAGNSTGNAAPAEHELTSSEQEWAFRSRIPDRLRVGTGRYATFANLLLPEESEMSDVMETARSWDAVGALADCALPSGRSAFYLPAGRTGLMNAHSTIVSTLIQNATTAGIRRADPLPALSGVRGDFLGQLVGMADPQKQQRRHPQTQALIRALGRRRAPLRKLGRRIEEEILGGAVKVDGLPGVAYPHFAYQPKEWEAGMPLANASSMVSEIAPVVLYLRHVVAPGDLLIIDEPESHLHPALQVVLTRLIAEIVRAGVRVIVTTHSEWVLEELGNIAGRARLADRTREESSVVSLDAHDIGVWLFEPGTEAGGSTVKEIELDFDTGLYPSGFDAVATALHNEWAEVADTRGDDE